MDTNILYNEFLRLGELLNRKLNLEPLLYGSLGLGKLLGIEFNPQDIDFLVKKDFLNKRWSDLSSLIQSQGYILEDEREHQFFNGTYRIAFAEIDVLKRDLGIDLDSLEGLETQGVRYKSLSLNQYLKAYEFSSKDGYRRDKNSNKDFYKIQSIKEAIIESHR